MRTTRFWNSLHQVRSKSKIGKANNFKSLRARKPKGLKTRKPKSVNLCMIEENLSFIDNCIFMNSRVQK